MSNIESTPEFPEHADNTESHGAQSVSGEVLESRAVPLGGLRAMTVHRTLPQRGRSLVGAWCFLDHYGPDDVADSGGMHVARHPHTGLATVSWLFTGQIDHLDSAGNRAAVRPGELNLMIAGSGITHQELSAPGTRTLHGVQLWYALPEGMRFSEPGFSHYVPEAVACDGGTARVFLGELCGSRSPVDTRTTKLLGVELMVHPDAAITLELRADFEHAVLAESGAVTVNELDVPHRSLGYFPTGRDLLTIRAGGAGARVILLGGAPFGEEIVMWWNFVGRSHDEIVEFRRRYQAELGFDDEDPQDTGAPVLFGTFPPDTPDPIPAPPMPISRLKPRA